MSWIDWLIVIVPVIFVLWMGFYSRRYIRDVSDYLSAGRLCGRYVISVADIANGISIVGIVAYVEVHYKTGFALALWGNFLMPISMILGLTGYCTYRFRETRAMSLGQFLEMRYSRKFRIFAAALRSLSEILANMIMPAIAARFFIYFLGLPHHVDICGFRIETFMLLMMIVLILAVSIICMGGTLALVITDTIQGFFCYPLMVLFIIFILWKFSWTKEIIPVMADRAPGESFLNPYDVSKLRDFNMFSVAIGLVGMFLHRASWIGAGNSSAAKSPHEQKMAGLLGTWRNSFGSLFCILISVSILALLNHQNFADQAKTIRTDISNKIAQELIPDAAVRARISEKVTSIPAQRHRIGIDAPLSDKKNLDTTYLDAVHGVLKENKVENANAVYQQFRTLYHQLKLAFSMRSLLPAGLLGLFCLLLILAMISTDDTRIYSATLTIAQDVILPLKKKPFTPKEHVWMIRFVSIGVGVFFFFGSLFMSQLDYINLFVTIVTMMWMGGCGPVMIFGLYSRFGNTIGAWTSLLSGMFLALFSIVLQRNWANFFYPFLEKQGWVDTVGNILASLSAPLAPWVVWEMNPVKCPINSYEFYFITIMITLVLYCVVSWATFKEPFNLDRMLHRGVWNVDGEKKAVVQWSWRTLWLKLIGITPEYTRGDKAIAWGFFTYTFVYRFIFTVMLVIIWNLFSPWKNHWWGTYFFYTALVVPGIVAFFSCFWFGIGGAVDLVRLFRDLKLRVANPLDDGRVDGHVSLADKEKMEKIENAGK